MFIPVVLGLLDTSGKDMPLSSVYHDGALKSIASGSQPAYSTILRVTKVRAHRWTHACFIFACFSFSLDILLTAVAF